MDRIKQRMIAFCDWLKETRGLKNDKVLANTLGIPASSLSTLRSGKRGFAVDTLSVIAYNHPQLNTYWLLTGTGEMLDGKKVLVHTISGIQEYVPQSHNPLANYQDSEDLVFPMRGADGVQPLMRDAQEVLSLKREVEKWKDKYIQCLESAQKDPK